MKVITERAGDLVWVRVYNYTLDAIKELQKAGWRLSGTYHMFCTLWKYSDEI